MSHDAPGEAEFVGRRTTVSLLPECKWIIETLQVASGIRGLGGLSLGPGFWRPEAAGSLAEATPGQ